jgi:hypothetical protein
MIVIKLLTVITYIGMVVVNALANILPINGIPTGAVSDSYPNLFAPAGVTFSIWGLIYLLLSGYTIYQFAVWGSGNSKKRNDLFEKTNKYFIATSLVNIVWIFCWHYLYIPLTLLLMIILLYFLIKIADLLNQEKFSFVENILWLIPFSIYFGWITIATIANVTVFLVSINWKGFGIADDIWMIVILLIGTVIAVWRTLKDRNIAYGLVPVWAYFGIWLKHTSANGFGGLYPNIINTTIFCLVIFLLTNSFVLYQWLKR